MKFRRHVIKDLKLRLRLNKWAKNPLMRKLIWIQNKTSVLLDLSLAKSKKILKLSTHKAT